MIKGGYEKYCSILNYLKDTNAPLYGVIDFLCINRLFHPRGGDKYRTFLCPDSDLVKSLEKQVHGPEPEKVFELLKSCLLPVQITDISEFSGEIPTLADAYLKVEKSGSKVELAGGATLENDPKFKAWNPHGGAVTISVFKLSGGFPQLSGSIDSKKVKSEPKGKGTKKGGAEISTSRDVLFEKVFDAHKASMNSSPSNKRNPAAEVLVAMCIYFKSNDKEIYELICSQLSFDALASLAIVLQPFKRCEEDKLYIKDSEFEGFAETFTDKNGEDTEFYISNIDVNSAYMSLMNEAAKNLSGKASAIHSLRRNALGNETRITTIKNLSVAFSRSECNDVFSNYAVLRKKMSCSEKIAEAELRVVSAILHDNENLTLGRYENMKLVEPYYCKKSDPNLAFYYSTSFLILRSDAFLYFPGLDQEIDCSKTVKNITANSDIDHDGDLKCYFEGNPFYSNQVKKADRRDELIRASGF